MPTPLIPAHAGISCPTSSSHRQRSWDKPGISGYRGSPILSLSKDKGPRFPEAHLVLRKAQDEGLMGYVSS